MQLQGAFHKLVGTAGTTQLFLSVQGETVTRLPDGTGHASDDTRESGGLVAVYGTLMRGFDNHVCAGMEHLDFVCECTIPGLLYDLGEFPGVKLACDGHHGDAGPVTGELYRARPADIDRLDRFEGAVGDDPLYRRRRVELLAPSRTAWVYECARRVDDAPLVESGDWREHAR